MRLVPALLGVLTLIVGIGIYAALPGGADDPPAAAAPAAIIGPSPTLGVPPPPGAVVLLAGSDLSGWTTRRGEAATWKPTEGAVVSSGGDIVSKETFTDVYLHLEWCEPDMPNAAGQARGNSGIAIQGRYEIQVLDSYGIDVPGKGDCGAVYGQSAALVNACRPPLEWQTFDMVYRAPRFGEDGKMTANARVTVLQNGIVIQNNTEITGVNYPATEPDPAKPGPLVLQDHGCKVQYRNIWFLPLAEKGSDAYEGHRG